MYKKHRKGAFNQHWRCSHQYKEMFNLYSFVCDDYSIKRLGSRNFHNRLITRPLAMNLFLLKVAMFVFRCCISDAKMPQLQQIFCQRGSTLCCPFDKNIVAIVKFLFDMWRFEKNNLQHSTVMARNSMKVYRITRCDEHDYIVLITGIWVIWIWISFIRNRPFYSQEGMN